MSEIKWSEVPTSRGGFVNYTQIPSGELRQVVARLEHKKLSEELKARQQWSGSPQNAARLKAIYSYIQILQKRFDLNASAGC